MKHKFFSPALFRKQVTRFWPLWGGYSLGLLLLLPGYFLTYVPWGETSLVQAFRGWALMWAVNPLISCIVAGLSALAVWSYLCSRSAAGLIHGLPVRREGLFFTNYLAGLSFILVPNGLIFLLSLAAQGAVGGVDFYSLWMWLVCQSLMAVFFFSLATFVALITGNLLALPALYVILNGLFWGLERIFQMTFARFIYGYSSMDDMHFLSFLFDWGSPYRTMGMRLERLYDGDGLIYGIAGFSVLVIYAALGLLLSILALRLYKRRQMETAGEVICVPALRPVFKYGAAFCGALTFGDFFCSLLGGRFFDSRVSFGLLVLLWGAVFYFLAEMLLRKSFRVVKQSYRDSLVVLAVLLLGMGALRLDPLGYEKRIPAQEEIASVHILGVQSGIIDGDIQRDMSEEYIAAVVLLHQTLVEEKRSTQQGEKDTSAEQFTVYAKEGEGSHLESITQWHIMIDYTLRDGKQISRSYTVPIKRELIERPGTSAYLLDTLLNTNEWRVLNHFSFRPEPEEVLGAYMEKVTLPIGADAALTAYSVQYHSRQFSTEEAQLLLSAVLEDMDAGRLGQQHLLCDEAYYETKYENYIYFSIRERYNDSNGQSEQWNGLLNTPARAMAEEEQYIQVGIPLQSTATETLSVLEALGIAEGNGLVLRAELVKNRGY